MKKLLLLFALTYMFIVSTMFGQGIYFSEPLSGDTLYSDSSGHIAISYHMYAAAYLTVGQWRASLQYPDGNWSNWMIGQSGGWYVTKAGTYHIKGKAWAKDWMSGTAWKWYYRDPYTIYCVDNIAPQIPQGLSSASYNNHPKIEWTANTEYDIDYYEIYKKKNSSSYSYYDQTENNYYVDIQELLYSGGGNKAYVYYKVKAVDVNANKSSLSTSVSVTVNGGIEKGTVNNEDVLNEYILFENYPNPFNPSTTISYYIPNKSFVSLKIYNSIGKEVSELVNEIEEPGKYMVVFNADNLPSGTYFYRFQSGSFSEVKKMIILN